MSMSTSYIFYESEMKPYDLLKGNIYFHEWRTGVPQHRLASLCKEENWGIDYRNLSNYIIQLFSSIVAKCSETMNDSNCDEYDNGISFSPNGGQYMCFNTGLVTPTSYESVYCFCERNRNDKQRWVFKKWATENFISSCGFFNYPPRKFIPSSEFNQLNDNSDIASVSSSKLSSAARPLLGTDSTVSHNAAAEAPTPTQAQAQAVAYPDIVTLSNMSMSASYVIYDSRKKVYDLLFSNIYIPDWNSHEPQRQLASLCKEEKWGVDYCILSNYIVQLFSSIVAKCSETMNDSNCDEYDNGISFSPNGGQYMCFNTGLVTPTSYESVYCFCERNRNDKPRWVFKKWATEYFISACNLFRVNPPRKFIFFSDFHELYFNPEIDMNLNAQHILQDDENHGRMQDIFPSHSKSELIQRLDGAIVHMYKRVRQNPRTVLPQVWQRGIQLLLPLSFDGVTVPLVLPAFKQPRPLSAGEIRDIWNPKHWKYDVRTILTREMAYNNARLMNSLESEWLIMDDRV